MERSRGTRVVAVKRRIKKQEGENINDSSIRKVIAGLEQARPITKKEACEILNISYNTARLARILEDWKETQSYIKSRKEANRGKPASQYEIGEAVFCYLKGQTISEIAKGLFRSPGFIKNIIDKVGVPQKSEDITLPDNCISDSFEEKEVVWAAAYNRIALVQKELTPDYVENCRGMKNIDYEAKYGCKVYQIYVLEEVENSSPYFPYVETGGFAAYACAYDLGSLKHLQEFGVDLKTLL